jgi:hypothetical protein
MSESEFTELENEQNLKENHLALAFLNSSQTNEKNNFVILNVVKNLFADRSFVPQDDKWI